MTTNVLITGAAGYIGSMLIDSLSPVDSIGRILAIDLRDGADRCQGHEKVRFIQADVSDDAWMGAIRDERVDVVVHCAYQIRQLYGSKAKVQRRWNMGGARKVFEFALGTPSVRRLIQLSTVSAYGAHATNSVENNLTERAPLGEDEYLYGAQKKEIEGLLRQLHERYRPSTHVVVLRLASVSGPRSLRTESLRPRLDRGRQVPVRDRRPFRLGAAIPARGRCRGGDRHGGAAAVSPRAPRVQRLAQ
jgi:nucleoside-diphosphate-sugar epimerase